MFKKWFLRLKIVVSILILLLFLFVIFENSTPTTVSFLGTDIELPLSAWIFIAYTLGVATVLWIMFIGWFSSSYNRMANKRLNKKIQEKVSSTEKDASNDSQ